MRFMAVDPGLDVGVAVYNTADTFFDSWIVSYDKAMRVFEDATQLCDEVAYERYVITYSTLKKTRQYEALYTIGFVIFLGVKYDVPTYPYLAGDATEFATNDKLKRIGWYKPGKPDHHNSAARVLLLHLSRKYPDLFTSIWKESE